MVMRLIRIEKNAACLGYADLEPADVRHAKLNASKGNFALVALYHSMC